MSSNNSENTKPEANGENGDGGVVFGEFWEKKISTFVKRIDQDKDGIISIKEFEWLAERYLEFSGCGEDKAKEVRDGLNMIWKVYFEEAAKVQPVTPKVYCDALRKFGKNQLVLVVNNFFPHFFDVIDRDGNGKIGVEDYRQFLDIFGMDPADADESFGKLDVEKNGVLSREEFLTASVEFCTGEDEASPYRHFLGRLLD